MQVLVNHTYIQALSMLDLSTFPHVSFNSVHAVQVTESCLAACMIACLLACFFVFIVWLVWICLFACLFLCHWFLMVFVSLFFVFFVFVWLVACLSFAHVLLLLMLHSHWSWWWWWWWWKWCRCHRCFPLHAGRWGQASRDRFDSGSVSFSVQGEVHVGMKCTGWYELCNFLFGIQYILHWGDLQYLQGSDVIMNYL